MFKTFAQLLLLSVAVVGAAFAEAFLPVVIDGHEHPPHGYIVSTKNYGTSGGWHKCMAGELTKLTATANTDQYASCVAHVSKFHEVPRIRVSVLGFTEGRKCGATEAGELTRAAIVTLTNESRNTHFIAAQINAYNSIGVPSGASGRLRVDLPPGATQTVCFPAFRFNTREDLRAFERHEAKQRFRVEYGNGFNATPVAATPDPTV